MARTPNRFIDPKTGAFYDWPINHTTEEAMGGERNIERTAPTSGVGFVRQQGDDSPMTLRMTGTTFLAAQDATFVDWYALSRLQTIHFRDWTGALYEVQITRYLPQRERVDWNYRDATMRHHIIRWTMELDILNALSGPWADVA